MTAEGAPPPMPHRRDRVPGWGPVALREILRRELYRGEVVWNRRQKADRGGRTKFRILHHVVRVFPVPHRTAGTPSSGGGPDAVTRSP